VGAEAGLDTRAKQMSTRQRRHHPSLDRPHCQTLYGTTHLPDRLHFIPPLKVCAVHVLREKRERKEVAALVPLVLHQKQSLLVLINQKHPY
jgi:hypothetical protein